MATVLYLASCSSGTTTTRGTGPIRAAADPLLTLVKAFSAEQARIDADDDASDAEFGRLYDRLTHYTPECRTPEGAIAALRLIADDMEDNISHMHGAVLASVQTFLSRRA